MKLRFGVVLALIIAVAASPLAAQDAQKSGRTVLQAIGKLKQAQAATRPSGDVRPDVIYWNLAYPAFMFPGAGNVLGIGGTHFKSDVTLANFGNAPQRVEVIWLRQGTNSCDDQTMIMTLQPGFRHFDDFVGTTLGQTGLGTLVFLALDDEDDIDSSAMLDGFSRIWTPLPGSAGTTSQQFTAVSIDDLIGEFPAYAIGLRQDSGFRTNAGVVNLDEEERNWTLEIHTSGVPQPASVLMTVPGCSMRQTNIPAGSFGTIMLRWVPMDPIFLWSAYGSSTDNTTGDGWVVQANHGPDS
jgi:hypothetical protein